MWALVQQTPARCLAGELGFLDIPRLVERALERVPVTQAPTLDDIFAADQAARICANE